MVNKVTCIFCDDIRVEQSGKLLIIGAYTGQLVLPNAPWVVGLATLVQIFGLSPGPHTVELIGTYHHPDGSGGEVARGKFNAHVVTDQLPTTLSPTGMNFKVEKDGVLVLWATIDGTPSIEAGRIPVAITPSP